MTARTPSPSPAGQAAAERDLDAPKLPELDILAELGRGAGSIVYRARKGDCDYAVKVLNPAAADLDTVLAYLRREAALLASVNHPRLPRIHEVSNVGSRPYMVMDLVDGRPLADLIRRGALPIPQALGLILDIVEPLALMHDQGLVHRDIKPQNVMVLDDGTARLIDFGLATREMSVHGAATGPGSPNGPRSPGSPSAPAATAVGTLAYASPEQAGTLRRPVDNRSDLYSTGVLLFECITGSLPFSGTDVGDLLRQHATSTAADLRTLLVEAGDGLAAVVATLLAKDPDDRYQNAGVLAEDLRRLLADPHARFTPGSAIAPRREGALVGRDREVAALLGLWRRAGSGHGASAVLRGTEGIGLTRVAKYVCDQARADSCLVLVAICRADDPVPLAPLRRAVERLLRETQARGEAERHALISRIRAAAGTAGPLLASLSPALGAVLQTTALPDADRQQQFSSSVAGFLADLATMCQGMVLTVDDIHLADPETLRVLGHLASHTPHVPLLTLSTARAGNHHAAEQPQVVERARRTLDLDLGLGPLDAAGIAALVTSRLPGIDLGSTLANLLTSRCQGNPFVTLEYLRAIVDAGLLRPHWGSWLLDTNGLNALALPEDALGLVLARAGGLDDEARQLLVVAAAIGSSFHPDVVAEVSAVDSDLAMAAMSQAVGLHLVDLGDSGQYTFLHARIRQALLDGLSANYLTDLHQTIAEVLDRRFRSGQEHPLTDPDGDRASGATGATGPSDPAGPITEQDQIFDIAHHYLLGDPRRSVRRARDVCLQAGQLSLSSHAPGAAVVFLEHADRLQPEDPRLLFLLATALRRDGRYSVALERCQQALSIERTAAGVTGFDQQPAVGPSGSGQQSATGSSGSSKQSAVGLSGSTGQGAVRRARILLLVAEIERSRWNTIESQQALESGLAELGQPMRGNAVTLTVAALRRAVLGVLTGLTGWGFGSASGAERERNALIAALHTSAAYIATISTHPGRPLQHLLLSILPLNRLAAGPEYVHGMSGLGFMLRVLGLERISMLVLRQAQAAAAQLDDPQLMAIASWSIAGSTFLAGRDDGEAWQQCLSQYGRWLDAGQVSDAAAATAWEATVMGRSGQARAWYESGLQLVDVPSEQEVTSLVTIAAVTHTASGRTIEATAELRRAALVLDGHASRGLQVNLLLAQMHAFVEQAEFGQPFEEAADRFFALGLNSRHLIRSHRLFFVHYAFGRLAQCQLAAHGQDEQQRRVAAGAARTAVRLLRRSAMTPATRAFAEVARAQLDVLEHQPRRALRRLARIEPVGQGAPVLDFELARTTARAFAAAGDPQRALRQARLARLIADDAAMPWRARWIAQEFELGERAAVESPQGLRVSGDGEASFGVERQRLQALQEISRAAAKVLDPDELARICLDRTLHILSAERAVLFLCDDDDTGALETLGNPGGSGGSGGPGSADGRGGSAGPGPAARTREPLRPHLSRDANGQDVPGLTGYSASLVERVRETREPIVITGTEEGAALGAQSVVLHGLRSIMVAPLQLEGRLLGVVYLDSQVAKGIFTAEDAGILLALMTHIATSLETARAAELQVSVRTAEQERDLAEALRLAFQEMSGALEPDGVLARLVASIGQVLPGSSAWLLAADGPELQDHGLQALLAQRRPAQGDHRILPPAALQPLLGDAAAWTVLPLHSADTAIGLLVVAAPTASAVAPAATGRSQVQRQVAGALAAQAITAWERAALFARVQELAVVDELTGIANRRRFFEVAERDFTAALRHGRPLQATMIDIDHFKRINDSFGHATGDEVIRAVAGRLNSQVRETDLLARYGGEEFALVLPDTSDGAELAERLRLAVEQTPIQTRSGPIRVTVSLGLTAMRLDDDDVGAVLVRADEQLYRAKDLGRNRVVVG